MSRFTKATVATLTATALAAGLCTPASGASSHRYSATFANNTCTMTLRVNGKVVDTTWLSKAEAKEEEGVRDSEIPRMKALVKDKEKELAQQKKDNAPAAAIKKSEKYIADSNELIKHLYVMRPVFRACAQGKSITEDEAEAQGKADMAKDEADMAKDEAGATLSTADGKLTEAGIGVVTASVIAVVIAGIIAALPMIKPLLPPQIAAMLP